MNAALVPPPALHGVHRVVQGRWDAAYGEHLVALRDVWDRQEAAIARALPPTVDDDPVNLLDQRPADRPRPHHRRHCGPVLCGR